MTLLNSTGVPKVDSLVCEIIDLLESNFPSRIRGYYMMGSYADNSAIATSDLDMLVVFKSSLNPDEAQRFSDRLAQCQLTTSIPLDIDAANEEDLLDYGVVNFRRASLLMYGEDIRPLVTQEQPIDSFIRGMMHNQYGSIAGGRGNPEVLTIPLDYPDPAGEFYGYDSRPIVACDGTTQNGTKNLVLLVLWLTTALLAFTTGEYIVTKRQCVTLYRRLINDEWTELIETVYEQCRNRWNYFVPSDPVERQQLRALCDRTGRLKTTFSHATKGFSWLSYSTQRIDTSYMLSNDWGKSSIQLRL